MFYRIYDKNILAYFFSGTRCSNDDTNNVASIQCPNWTLSMLLWTYESLSTVDAGAPCIHRVPIVQWFVHFYNGRY